MVDDKVEEIRVVTIEVMDKYHLENVEVLGVIRGPVKSSSQIYNLLSEKFKYHKLSIELLKECSTYLFTRCNYNMHELEYELSRYDYTYRICIELFKD